MSVFSAPAFDGHELVAFCDDKTTGLRAIIEGDASFKQVRPVSPEDLLGRETVSFQAGPARSVVAGRTVMVTGAGGSIGGELCRQLLPLGPAEMILLGRGENSIFEIMNDIIDLGIAGQDMGQHQFLGRPQGEFQ